MSTHPNSRTAPRLEALQALTQQARTVILSRQDPITGLLPASTAITVHGDYTHAWVRDNVYSILAVWALGRAWRATDPAQADDLDAATTRLMRGLLLAMMRQSHKVERFKRTQHPHDALHAKYSTQTGESVVGDAAWGHLQIDATAIFLLMLTQMSAGGLSIVRDRDELNFVQNLVWYLAHAWRTPDYGIWERGHKRNDGQAEVNASSVGMAKAALEVVNGAQLMPGADSPRIHVPADAIAQARHTLEGLLPRESESKETDAALLSIIGFPAFAVGDAVLVERTRAEIIGKLQGRYGCKRFLRDGHQTVTEDHSRLHYEPGELKQFEHIESEWPLFFCYLLIDAALRGDQMAARDYRTRLDALMVEQDGVRLLPELYFVPAGLVDAERLEPRSQRREPNDNVPLVWAQSLYLVGVLVHDRYVTARELLPRGRGPSDAASKAMIEAAREQVRVQVAVLGADRLVQARLASHGIACETPEQVQPLQVRYADDLALALAELGRVDRLGLTGRPIERLDSLVTSQVFTLAAAGGAGEQTIVFLPSFYSRQGFYLTLDNRLLVDEIRAEIAGLRRHWQVRDQQGQPLLLLLIGEPMLGANSAEVLLNFLKELGRDATAGVEVGPLATLLPRVRTTRMDWLDAAPWAATAELPATADTRLPPDLRWEEGSTRPLTPARAAALEHEVDPQVLLHRLDRSRNPYEQIEILGLLVRRGGAQWGTDRGCSVAQTVLDFHARACHGRKWGLIRRSAGVLDLHDDALEEAVTQIVVRQKRVAVGRAYGEGAVIGRPMGSADIHARISRYGGDDPRARVLLQEIVLLLGVLIKADAALFKGTLTLRAWYLILLITGWLAREHALTQAEAFDFLLSLSPHAILTRLREVIAHEQDMNRNLLRLQSLHGRISHDGSGSAAGLATVHFPASADPVLDQSVGGWLAWREVQGVITRLPEDFYARVWQVLRHFPGLVIGDQLDSRNQMDSRVARADMTPSERGFALQVEDLLNKIQAPEYRQLTIEALVAVSDICRANPQLRAERLLVMDVLVGVAVRVGWTQTLPVREPDVPAPDYNEHRGAAWSAFYASPPHAVAQWVMAALAFLMTPEPVGVE
ncbi:glycoside hydrolase family 15 protein [Sphaerotilus sp.]|uniref:glycoside hydrolase family 15 protein n=1 Tax=Sphaerotilus sp. TaxID=2093942 RepID=UPI00286D6E0F|nr:glycoside hydrolase family 15 protein [Sphaerotilus sp.]